MKDIYTKDEYKELVDAAPPYNLINSINFILVKGYAFNNSSCKSIPEFLKKEHPEISKFFYDIPLNWVPRFINHENDLIKAIALWRLRVSK